MAKDVEEKDEEQMTEEDLDEEVSDNGSVQTQEENSSDSDEEEEDESSVVEPKNLNFETTKFTVTFTDGQSVTVKGTRIIRPSDRDGLMIVDDNKALEAGLEKQNFTVLVVPNATLKNAYSESAECSGEESDWDEDENLRI